MRKEGHEASVRREGVPRVEEQLNSLETVTFDLLAKPSLAMPEVNLKS